MLLTAPGVAGDTRIQVDRYACGLAPGSHISLGLETVVMAGWGSILLQAPLRYNHSAGTSALALSSPPPPSPPPHPPATPPPTPPSPEAPAAGPTAQMDAPMLLPATASAQVAHEAANQPSAEDRLSTFSTALLATIGLLILALVVVFHRRVGMHLRLSRLTRRRSSSQGSKDSDAHRSAQPEPSAGKPQPQPFPSLLFKHRNRGGTAAKTKPAPYPAATSPSGRRLDIYDVRITMDPDAPVATLAAVRSAIAKDDERRAVFDAIDLEVADADMCSSNSSSDEPLSLEPSPSMEAVPTWAAKTAYAAQYAWMDRAAFATEPDSEPEVETDNNTAPSTTPEAESSADRAGASSDEEPRAPPVPMASWLAGGEAGVRIVRSRSEEAMPMALDARVLLGSRRSLSHSG